MLVLTRRGDITDVTEGVILHGCNMQGKMGSGVAKAISDKWPSVKDDYLTMFDEPPMSLGYSIYTKVSENLYVASGLTQEYYGFDGDRYASLNAISVCLSDACEMSEVLGLYEVHIPRIGGGLGGLDFDEEVYPVIHKVASEWEEVTITIWEV